MRRIVKNGKSELKQKFLTPASRDNGIKKDVVVVQITFKYILLYRLLLSTYVLDVLRLFHILRNLKKCVCEGTYCKFLKSVILKTFNEII